MEQSPAQPGRSSAHAQRPVRVAWGLAAIAAFALAGPPLDRLLFDSITIPKVHRHDWYWLLRQPGDLRVWLIVGIAFWLLDRGGRDPFRRCLLVLCAPGLAGIMAEGLKMIVRRERPSDTGEYIFRHFGDGPLLSSGLGFPSGHTAVAFGAACILTYIHPRGWLLWFTLAAGCGASRLMAGAHFFTDVAGGAAVGALAAWLIRLTDRPRPSAITAVERVG